MPDPAPIVVTERDEKILRHVFRHRFLRSDQIVRLLGTSAQPVLRRLQLLYHHGYLDRPRAQKRYYEKNHNRALVYGIAKKGLRHLQEMGLSIPSRSHEKKVKNAYLEHTLLIAEFMTRLETELPDGVNLHYGDEIPGILYEPHRWKVPIVYQGEEIEIGVIPDRVFGISTREDSLVFVLEADRGTMPVIRSNPRQTSFYRKILAYHQTWKQDLHKTLLGWRRFRVLTVTSSPERMESMVALAKEATKGGGAGLFLFSDVESLAEAPSIHDMPWTSGHGNTPAFLVC